MGRCDTPNIQSVAGVHDNYNVPLWFRHVMFRIQKVQLRWGSGHEEENDILRPRDEMRLNRRRLFQSTNVVGLEQVHESDRSQSPRGLLKKAAAGTNWGKLALIVHRESTCEWRRVATSRGIIIRSISIFAKPRLELDRFQSPQRSPQRSHRRRAHDH